MELREPSLAFHGLLTRLGKLVQRDELPLKTRLLPSPARGEVIP